MSLRGITHSFGAVRALVDVDLDVHAHEVVAVVGDNGAGKSTLVGVMSGALVPDAGEVVVDGQEVLLRSPGLARQLGIAEGAPLLRMERMTHAGDTPVDFEFLYYRGDAFQYRLRIDRS